MTKFLKALCVSIFVIISTIFLPVRILLAIVIGIIDFLRIGAKEYFSELRDEIAMGVKIWWNCITALYAKD